LKNHHFKLFFFFLVEKKELEKNKDRVSFKFDSQRLRPLYNLALAGRPLFATFSIATALTLITLLFNQLFNIFWLSLSLALVLLVVWEYSKALLFQNALETHYSKTNATWLFLAVSLFSVGSFVFSIFGAKDLVELSQNKEVIIFTDYKKQEDSINILYENKLSNINSSIANIEQFRAKNGWLSTSNTSTLAHLQKQYEETANDKKNIIAQIEQKQSADINKNKAETGNVSVIFIILAIVLESLLVLCNWFVSFYRYTMVKDYSLFCEFVDNPNQLNDVSDKTVKQLSGQRKQVIVVSEKTSEKEINQVNQENTPPEEEQEETPTDGTEQPNAIKDLSEAAKKDKHLLNKDKSFEIKGFNQKTSTNDKHDTVHTLKNCVRCSKSFTPYNVIQKYCSIDCRQEAYEERTGKKLRIKDYSK